MNKIELRKLMEQNVHSMTHLVKIGLDGKHEYIILLEGKVGFNPLEGKYTAVVKTMQRGSVKGNMTNMEVFNHLDTEEDADKWVNDEFKFLDGIYHRLILGDGVKLRIDARDGHLMVM